MNYAQEKARYREQYRAVRQAVSVSDRAAAASSASDVFFNEFPLANEVHNIGYYWPMLSEFDPRPIMRRFDKLGAAAYLPRVSLPPEKTLSFYQYRFGEHLTFNEYRILEPVADRNLYIALDALDVVFVPLLSVDDYGTRLGVGCGYYDRTFQAVEEGSSKKRPVLIGLCFDQQKTTTLPQEPWDIKLDFVLSEQDFTRCK